VLRGWSKWWPEKRFCAAGMGEDAGDQVGKDGYQDDDRVRVSSEALRATICKSKEGLAMHKPVHSRFTPGSDGSSNQPACCGLTWTGPV
jgi:hypothetical protein